MSRVNEQPDWSLDSQWCLDILGAAIICWFTIDKTSRPDQYKLLEFKTLTEMYLKLPTMSETQIAQNLVRLKDII